MSLINLTKRYEKINVVSDVSLDMTNGVYGLLGVNGAGKTTLMRMICTLIQPTHGSITYDGKNIFELEESYRKELGYLPQDFGVAYVEEVVEKFRGHDDGARMEF